MLLSVTVLQDNYFIVTLFSNIYCNIYSTLSILTPRPSKTLLKSRNRIYGKKKSHDYILKEIVKLVSQGTEPTKIAEITGKGRSSIWRYLDEASKLGLVKKTSTGRINVPKPIQDSKTYEVVERNKFVQKYDLVKRWEDDMRTRNGGKPLTTWGELISKLKTICDTLNISPYEMLSPKDGKPYGGAESILRDFASAMQQGKVKHAS